MRNITRLALLSSILASAGAYAGTITVTSPNNGDFLGRTNTLKFTIKQSVVKAKVTATVTFDADPTQKITVSKDFDPNTNGEITGDLTLNFAETFSEGDYTITVTVQEPNNPYNTEIRNVKVDVRKPQFRSIQPIQGAFVKGNVPIKVKLGEPNIKEWRVKINDEDIPNNSGDTETFTVNWNASSVQKDGQQRISITADDLASNTAAKEIQVTVDRRAPSAAILTPHVGQFFKSTSNVAVSLDFNDQFQGSVDPASIEVIVATTKGKFIQRVSRRVAIRKDDDATGVHKIQWTGRIKYSKKLPKQFKIIVNGLDRAGNVAVTQEVAVKLGS